MKSLNLSICDISNKIHFHHQTLKLEQIKEKKYHEKYLNKAEEITIIGIEFSKKDRNICKFDWERIV